MKFVFFYLTNNRFTKSITKLKKVSYVFIITQILDIVTTFIGLKFANVWEWNSMGFNLQTVLIKLAFIFLIVYVLEHEKYFKFMWAVPIVSGIAPVWNVGIIILSIVFT